MGRSPGSRWAGPLASGLGVALLLLAAGPARSAPTFEGEGRVVATDVARGTVTLDHGEISGLLPARRSAFALDPVNLLRALTPGDRVRFSLAAADESHGLLRLSTLLVERPAGSGVAGLLAGVAATLGAAALVVAAAAGGALWRALGRLQRRITALDHELGALRDASTEAVDASRQIVQALEEIAHTVRLGLDRTLRGRPVAPGDRPADAPGTPAEAAAALLLVVQRGRPEVFRAAESRAAETGLDVIWDRRRIERRAARRAVPLDRRHRERRAAPAETWMRLGFALVPSATGPAPSVESRPAARPLRAVAGERGGPR